MPGLEDLYREIILDHYRTPAEPWRAADAAGRRRPGPQPAVRRRDHRLPRRSTATCVSDIKVGGQGCSISQSSASMMSQAVKGKRSTRCAALVRRFKGMMSIEDVADGDGDGDEEASAPASWPSATSRRCKAWSSSPCGSSAPPSPGTPCSKRSTNPPPDPFCRLRTAGSGRFADDRVQRFRSTTTPPLARTKSSGRARTRRATCRRPPTPRRRRAGRGRRTPATASCGRTAAPHRSGTRSSPAPCRRRRGRSSPARGGGEPGLVELVAAAHVRQHDLAVDGEDQALHDLADLDPDRRRGVGRGLGAVGEVSRRDLQAELGGGVDDPPCVAVHHEARTVAGPPQASTAAPTREQPAATRYDVR